MSLRVLHLTSGNLYGGVETYLTTLAECRELAPAMQPEFGLCFPGRHEIELRNSGCPVHMLGAVRFSRPWTVWTARRALARLLKANAYDAVVCHQPWIQSLFGSVIVRSGTVYVAYFHNVLGDDAWPERKAKRTRPQLVIAPSAYTLESTKSAFPQARHAVLHYPLSQRIRAAKTPDPRERQERREALGLKSNDVLIFQASRVEAWKGPDLVVEALASLNDLAGWQFWFAGAPQRPQEQTLFDDMKRVVTERGIADRVRFLGDRKDVPELMKLADVYTQGNRGIEGFGISYQEAAYCYLPIVTTVPGSMGDMVDDSNGLIVPPEDTVALSAAFRQVITDGELRKRLGNGGRAKAERQCDTRQQLNRLSELFAEATASMPKSYK